MLRSARAAAVHALIPAAERFPDIPIVEPDLAGLSDADARLAVAIHRTALQRWLTLEHILDRSLKQPARKLGPEVRAVLLAGAAQLVFLDRLPAYAVIDEAVSLAKSLGAGRAAGMVNAVLRKTDALVAGRSEEPWTPAADRLPDGEGGAIELSRNVLPKPDNLLAHLAVATSHPLPLLQRWFKTFGRETAAAIALHGLTQPPTFVVEDESARPWTGTANELRTWLAADPARRVQDPASLASVAAAADLDPPPETVLDLCAGRGTKTRQLAAVFPDARVVACEPDAGRLDDLAAAAEAIPNVTVRRDSDPTSHAPFDLIVLDVPCSNTGVLARRPGARYRATSTHLRSLVGLQREIITRALDHLAPSGRVLYCTCSIDPAENQEQARWLLEHAPSGAVLLREATLLPTPPDTEGSGHDGSYHALVGPPV